MSKSTGFRPRDLVALASLGLGGWATGTCLGNEGTAPTAISSKPSRDSWSKLRPKGATRNAELADEEEVEPEDEPASSSEVLHPRPADEWQGMLVNLGDRQVCDTSNQCGLALACLADKLCGPCRDDRDCDRGEGCVLDHCVETDLIECRERADCVALDPKALCVLSGLTGGAPRGNEGMTARCNAPRGGSQQTEEDAIARTESREGEYQAPPVDLRALREALRDETRLTQLLEEESP